MRLVRLGPAGAERPAVLIGEDHAVDVGDLFDDYGPPFLAEGGVERLASLSRRERDRLPVRRVAGERLGPPLGRPGKIVCAGLNYRDHAAEAGMELPVEPVLFGKASSSVCGPNDDVLLPPGADKVDWEVELGVVVGRVARYLPDVAAADEAIAGYCLVNDVSERSYQLERGGQWIKGKSAETFNPIGPWFATSDEIADPTAMKMSLHVNGELMQSGSTREMVFSPAYLVWYVSQFMVLEPGDLINTGTPAGVGMGFDPPRYLREGDVMELTIEGLGQQRQRCVRATVDR